MLWHMTHYSKIIASITITILTLTLTLPNLADAKAGGGSRGGSRSFGGSKMYSPNAVNRGSKAYTPNTTRPMERSAPRTTERPFGTTPNRMQTPQSSMAQPSFFQRNPMLSTFGAAIAGSWIGNMLFGNNSTHAATTNPNPEAVNPDGTAANVPANTDTSPTTTGSNTTNLLTLLALAIGVYFIFKLSRKKNFNSHTNTYASTNSTEPSPWSGHSNNISSFERGRELALPEGEAQEFANILTNIQNAWSNQDLNTLKRLCTTEMLSYFSRILNQNISDAVENKVTDISVLDSIVQEAWAEEGMEFASVLLRWTAKDYTINLHLQPYEPGFIVDGDQDHLTESTEVWTFTRRAEGSQWVLSAIQQV